MTKEELFQKKEEYENIKNTQYNEFQNIKRDYAEEHSIFKKGDNVLFNGIVMEIEDFAYAIESDCIFCICFVIAKTNDDKVGDSLVIYEKYLKKHE